MFVAVGSRYRYKSSDNLTAAVEGVDHVTTQYNPTVDDIHVPAARQPVAINTGWV